MGQCFWYTLDMDFGKLAFRSIAQNDELVAEPTRVAVEREALQEVLVSEIDAELADTASFCRQYGIGLEVSANCVIVEAKRGDETWYAACVIAATTKADVNGKIRRQLDARKASFAPMDTAVSLSKMQYGGITPIGLPAAWPILIDTQVANTKRVIIGSGLRSSKLLVPGKLLGALSNAVVMDITKSDQ
jgi:prolyl-tRNA editing enzyme YbaK/EbsC (Cys-tRNA(Pro) deacylase)